jgi:ADP-ribose pyrophosphatase
VPLEKPRRQSSSHAADERPTHVLGPPPTIDEEVVYASPHLVVRRVRKAMPSGEIGVFYIRDEADVAVCLPVAADGSLVLVEEFRHGPGRSLFEIPGGCVDPTEDIAAAAAREVLEETGFSGEVVHLASTWISAYSTARKHIFIMPAAHRISEPAPEPSELFRVVQVSPEDFRTVLAHGALTDLDAGLLCLQRLT